MSGRPGKRLMNGSRSASTTTLAATNAPTTAVRNIVVLIPYCLSISARVRASSWNVKKKNSVGAIISPTRCFACWLTLFMATPCARRRADFAWVWFSWLRLFAAGGVHWPEAGDAPEGQGEVKNNGGPEADAGQFQAESGITQHRHSRHVVEQHGRDDSARG